MDWSTPAAQLFAALGGGATLLTERGEVTVTVLVRDDVSRDPLAFAEPVRTGQVVLEMLTSAAAIPERGDVVRVGTTEYHVDRVDHASDELITRLICSDRSP
ncbi:MAG: hypothetical protein NHG36_14720 [Chromatiaceae bacterium]|nr:hypothetical protein [Candidatus Thioaporhodococcus sediminis]